MPRAERLRKPELIEENKELRRQLEAVKAKVEVLQYRYNRLVNHKVAERLKWEGDNGT